MTTRVWAASVLALAALTTAVPSAEGRDLPEIRAEGTLRVLVARNNGGWTSPSPFFAVEPGSASGFDRDVLERFARTHGLRLEAIVVSGYDVLIAELLAGRGDLIAGSFTDTVERRKVIDFTVEVLPTRNVVVTRKPHRVVATVEELRAERVGAGKGTSQREAVAAHGVPDAKVDESVAIVDLPEALRSGRVTAAVMESFGAFEAQRRDTRLQLGMLLGRPQSLAYGVRKDAPQLLAALNRHIAGGRTSSLWYELVVKYFGQAGPEMLRRSRD